MTSHQKKLFTLYNNLHACFCQHEHLWYQPCIKRLQIIETFQLALQFHTFKNPQKVGSNMLSFHDITNLSQVVKQRPADHQSG